MTWCFLSVSSVRAAAARMWSGLSLRSVIYFCFPAETQQNDGRVQTTTGSYCSSPRVVQRPSEMICVKSWERFFLQILSVNPPQEAESSWFLFSLSSRVHCKQELPTADSTAFVCAEMQTNEGSRKHEEESLNISPQSAAGNILYPGYQLTFLHFAIQKIKKFFWLGFCLNALNKLYGSHKLKRLSHYLYDNKNVSKYPTLN